jgi:1-phosphofructokinase
MIVTLTANPSLDRTITLAAALVPGEVQQAAAAREDAGGKGINVSRVIAAGGAATLAVLPLAADDPFALVLHATGVSTRPVPIDGHARANVTIADPQGVTTKLNLPGPGLSAPQADALIDAVVDAAGQATWLVLAGSLPPGVDDDFYARIIRAVRARLGHSAPRIAVDASGPALKAVVDGAMPDLIKPNDEELAELAGIELESGIDLPHAVLEIARRLVPARAGAALVTLGAHGAVLANADGAWAATPPRISVASTVGAGDSSLAGYLLADVEGAAPEDRLRRAIRYGAAAASLPGTQAPTANTLPEGDVAITPLD